MEIHIRRTRSRFGETKPKTESSIRAIPIFDALMPYIKSQYTKSGLQSEYVFINQYGEPYSSTDKLIQYYWSPLLRECGLHRRRLYDLRHMFVANVLNSGKFSAMDIARWMGHTNTQMLFTTYARYIKSEQKVIDRSFDLFGHNTDIVKIGNLQSL